MSLKLFFNRKGGIVLSLTAIGWILMLWNLSQLPIEWKTRGPATNITFILFFFLCLLITTIRFFPWYRREDRGAGIEEHFEKTLVPTSYILVITGILYRIWMHCWPFLLFVDLLLMVVQSVNCILIYFHRRDHDDLPPSYFARSLYEAVDK